MGDKITGMNDFACFFCAGKSYGPEGSTKKKKKLDKNTLQMALVRSFDFPVRWSEGLQRGFCQTLRKKVVSTHLALLLPPFE